MATQRVLVVEDEPSIRKVLVRLVTSNGNIALEAGDGVEALELLREAEDIDVVVSDITMPGMDGIELLAAVAELDPDIPVVLITGFPTLNTAIRAIELGAFQYVTKPFERDEIQEVIRRATQVRRMALIKSRALALSGLPGGRTGDLTALEASFSRGLQTIWIAYQPIVRAVDGSVYGYEALLRSNEPSLPHPGAMLHAAERLQRVHELGSAVRRGAATTINALADDMTLFVNIHPHELDDKELYEPSAPLSWMANRTVLEITERASIEEIPRIKQRVELLRQLGYRIAIDDLGAGYAGLTSFASLEPEFVKIDMSLIRGVDRDATRRNLIRAIVDLCREMEITVVAEGIETLEERTALIELGCDLLQGFQLARPSREFSDVDW